MYSIKVTHNGEVRRLTIPLDGIVATAYEQLIQTVRNLFPDLQVSRSFCLTWQDDEGDTVTVSSEMELTEAIRVMSTMYGGNSLRFTVKKIEKPVPVSSEPAAPAPAPFVEGGDRVAAAMKAEEAIHYGVQCDECGMSPIVGLRYKCTSRRNYDLCTSCYNKRTQPFPMIKIEEPVGGRCRRGRGRGGKCDPFEMPPHGPPHHHLHGHHGHHHRGGPYHAPHHPHGGGRGGRGMFHWFGGAPGEGIPYEGCEDYYGPFSDPAAEKEGDKKEAPAAPAPHLHPPRAHPFGGPFGLPHHGGPHPPMPPHGGIFGGRGGGRGGFCPFGAGGRGGGGAGRGGPFPWGGTPLVVEAEIYQQPAATEEPAAAKEGTCAAAPAPTAAPQSEGSVVHVGVTCDVCGVSPITGPRYKCTVRDNYDVCAACYESQLQPYPMLKIVTNGGVGTVVTPAAPIVRDLNDEDAGLQAAISESFAFTNAAASAAPVPAADVPPALLSRSTISVTSATVDDNGEGEGGVEDVYSEHSFTFVDKVTTPPPAPTAAAAPTAAPAAPSPVDTERLFAEAAATAERVHLTLVWAKELQLLADMGFTDRDELIPLLQQHIGTPASASTAASVNPVRQVEGMQQVVAALLLGQSGVRR